MIDFLQNIQTEEHNFQESFQTVRHGAGRSIPVSSELTGIEIRLSDVIIIDNKTPKIFPFPGLASVYFLNLVICDLDKDQISLDLKGFEKVDDGDKLNLDRVIFYWKQKNKKDAPPSQIHVFSSLIKSKQKLRDVAKLMQSAKEDDGYKEVISAISKLVNNASELTNISGLVLQAASIVGKYLGNVDDKPLLTQFQSFTDIAGDFDSVGELEKPATNKYASVKLTLTLRDKDRIKAS